MDRKEAILRIKEHMKHHGIGKYPHLKLKEALDMAIAALSPTNDPLTIEQLREMDGEPVWVDAIQKVPTCVDGWCVVFIGRGDGSSCALIPGDEDTPWEFLTYGTVWLAYRRPPEGEA